MSLYTRFVSEAMRATRPRSVAEARRTVRLAAAEWRRRRRPNPTDIEPQPGKPNRYQLRDRETGRIVASGKDQRNAIRMATDRDIAERRRRRPNPLRQSVRSLSNSQLRELDREYDHALIRAERALADQRDVKAAYYRAKGREALAEAGRRLDGADRAAAAAVSYLAAERRRAEARVGRQQRAEQVAVRPVQGRLFNPRKKKRPAVRGDWQPDLFGGAGIQRPEGATRAEQLALARQEMRDAGARDLFDVLAERQGNPNADLRELDRVGRQLDRANREATSLPTREERIRAHRRRERLTQRYRELSRNPRAANALRHGESPETAAIAAANPGAAIGRTSPPCPRCGAPVRLSRPTRNPTATCRACGLVSQVKRP